MPPAHADRKIADRSRPFSARTIAEAAHIQGQMEPGEVLSNDRDVVEGVLLHLSGIEALHVASTCRAFRDALAPSEAIWAEFYSSEFGEHGFSYAAAERPFYN